MDPTARAPAAPGGEIATGADCPLAAETRSGGLPSDPRRRMECLLIAHPDVAEVAVISRPDGNGRPMCTAFVHLREGLAGTPELLTELRALVCRRPGCCLRDIVATDVLPKTLSGKLIPSALTEMAVRRDRDLAG
ncbi:MAG: hypothetical protein IT208_14800 [Chthonomonadales bacterium]|nr:hypothetical protein [Chthonomonadales bacterium]